MKTILTFIGMSIAFWFIWLLVISFLPFSVGVGMATLSVGLLILNFLALCVLVIVRFIKWCAA